MPTDELNYVRNAVKATVDAYDGTVNLYAWDETDPMLEAWRNAFPGTVQDRDEIPDGVLEHLRYPEDMFKAQRYQFARYHVTDAGDFYRGSDRWEVPEDPNVAGSYQPPYRLFVDDPTAEGGETWSMTTVYTPIDRDNLAAFMSVDSDATGRRTTGASARCSCPTSRSTAPARSPTTWPTPTTCGVSCSPSTRARPSRPSATCSRCRSVTG